jgi:hypothetical protein
MGPKASIVVPGLAYVKGKDKPGRKKNENGIIGDDKKCRE